MNLCQNNCLGVFCIALHCIIQVSKLRPVWPSCFWILYVRTIFVRPFMFMGVDECFVILKIVSDAAPYFIITVKVTIYSVFSI